MNKKQLSNLIDPTIEVKEKFDEMKKEKGLTASELLEMLLNKK